MSQDQMGNALTLNSSKKLVAKGPRMGHVQTSTGQKKLADLFKKGVDCFRAGDYGQALAYWDLVLERVPGHRQTLKHVDAARAKIAETEKGTLKAALSSLGEEELREEEHTVAVAAENKPLSDGEANPEMLFKEGKRLFDRGRYRQARDRFEAALDLDPDHADAYMYSELAKAKEGDQQFLEETLLTAKALEEAGDPEGAAREWRKVLDLDPGNQRATAGLARLGEADVGSAPASASGHGEPSGVRTSHEFADESSEAEEGIFAEDFGTDDFYSALPGNGQRNDDGIDPDTLDVVLASGPPKKQRRKIRQLVDAASKAEAQGSTEAAIQLYEQIMELAPQSVLAQERLSSLRTMLQISQSRALSNAKVKLAEAQEISEHNPAKAMDLLRAALQIRPNLVEAQSLLRHLQRGSFARGRRARKFRRLLGFCFVMMVLIAGAVAWYLLGGQEIIGSW